MTSGLFERAYPLWGGVLGFVLFLVAHQYISLASDPKELLTTAINVSMVTVGFLASMEAILLSQSTKPAVVQLRQMQKFNMLLDYIMQAVSSCFYTAFLSGVVLFLLPHKGENWFVYLLSVWTGLTLTTALNSYRALSTLAYLMRE